MTTASPQISTDNFANIAANEAQLPSEGAETLQGGSLVSPNPPVSPSKGKNPRGPSNFASLSHSHSGRRSEFTELIPPSPEEHMRVSSSPPVFVTLAQVGFIILSGALGFLIAWHGVEFFSKPSK